MSLLGSNPSCPSSHLPGLDLLSRNWIATRRAIRTRSTGGEKLSSIEVARDVPAVESVERSLGQGECTCRSLLLVPSWFPLGSLLVPSWFPLGSLLVPSWFPLGSLLVPSWFPLGSLLVPSWFPLGSLLVPSWFPFGSLLAPFGAFCFSLAVLLLTGLLSSSLLRKG